MLIQARYFQRMDDLVMHVKEAVGEKYHIEGITKLPHLYTPETAREREEYAHWQVSQNGKESV